MSTAAKSPNPRRFLSTDALIAGLRRRFQEVPDRRKASGTKYSMADTLMAAFAMFSLAFFPQRFFDPSLLAFQERADEPSIKGLFGIDAIPSDTSMREILVDARNP